MIGAVARLAVGRASAEPQPAGSTGAADALAARGGGERVDLAALAPRLDGVAASISAVFAMQTQAQDGQQAQAMSEIHRHADAVKAALEQARQAAEKAHDEADDKSFWDGVASTAKTVGTVATVAAAGASMVASGGVTTPAALALTGVLLSASAHGIAGGNRSVETALDVAAAGASLGACGSTLLASSTAATLSSATQTAARGVQLGAGVTAGVATAAQGYAQLQAGAAGARKVEAEADGARARAHQRAAQRTIDDTVAALKELERSSASAKDSLRRAQQDHASAAQAMLSRLSS